MNTTTLTHSAETTSPRARFNRLKQTTQPVTKPARVEPAVETPAAGSATTDRTKVIIARVNVGWGNTLYLRGEGGRLSWDIGVPMICTGDDRWAWSCRTEELPHQFKFLRNDQVWELGDNQIMSGADITVCNPKFPD